MDLPWPALAYMGVATTAFTLWIEMHALKDVRSPVTCLLNVWAVYHVGVLCCLGCIDGSCAHTLAKGCSALGGRSENTLGSTVSVLVMFRPGCRMQAQMLGDSLQFAACRASPKDLRNMPKKLWVKALLLCCVKCLEPCEEQGVLWLSRLRPPWKASARREGVLLYDSAITESS